MAYIETKMQYPKFFIAAPFGNYMRHKNAISVKGTFTLNPNGNRVSAILRTLRYDFKNKGWVNRLGLPNPGLQFALDKYTPGDIISVTELERDDFVKIEAELDLAQSLEINLSCPNVKSARWDRINIFPNKYREWCIAKMAPQSTMEEIGFVVNAGFTQLHFSNTLPTARGGLSGPTLIPYTTKLIKMCRDEFPHTTIIAGGGVTKEAHIHHYMDAGADHISVGSAWFNPIKTYRLLSK